MTVMGTVETFVTIAQEYLRRRHRYWVPCPQVLIRASHDHRYRLPKTEVPKRNLFDTDRE